MYIGVDLGGTNIAVGAVDNDGRILAKKSCPTKRGRSYKEIVKDMARLCLETAGDAGFKPTDIEGIGIGSPGTVDSRNGVVVYAANLEMEKCPVAEEMKLYINAPVVMENDANAVAYGEYTACGDRAESFILITLGTGVGSGIILDNKIYRGFNNAGGEIGHTAIYAGGEECTCGRRGCFESYASVTALIRQTKEMLEKYPCSSMNEWVRREGRVSGRTAFECAAQGDEAAIITRDRYIGYVAEGITNVINIFQPEILAIGGGISKEGDTLLLPVKEFVYKNDFNKFMKKTDIRIAKLFNDAGIVGAAMSARNTWRK